MCVPNLRSIKDIPADIAQPLMAASRGFDIIEFFLKIFALPPTFKTVLPAMYTQAEMGFTVTENVLGCSMHSGIIGFSSH